MSRPSRSGGGFEKTPLASISARRAPPFRRRTAGSFLRTPRRRNAAATTRDSSPLGLRRVSILSSGATFGPDEHIPRTSSGSRPSARPVNPTRSVNSTLTIFRSSPAWPGSAASEAPHMPHRRNPSGFSWPHAGQICTPIRYRAGSGNTDPALSSSADVSLLTSGRCLSDGGAARAATGEPESFSPPARVADRHSPMRARAFGEWHSGASR